LVDVNQQRQAHLLQSPFSQRYNLNISGGSRLTRNFLSTSFDEERSNYIGDTGNRLAVNFSNQTKISPKLTFSAETFITMLKQANNGIGLDARSQVSLLPYDRIVDEDGTPARFSYMAAADILDELEDIGYHSWK